MRAKTDPAIILHPIRVRIVYAVEGRPLTSGQIALEMPDVPQASLYRHIRKLHDAGVLVIKEERQVHGTVERVYQAEPAAVFIDAKKLGRKDKAIRFFEIFLFSVRHAFARYVDQRHFDLKEDAATFYSEFAYLSDEEQTALNNDIRERINAAKKNAPQANRRRRVMSFVALPEPPAQP